MSDIKWLFRNYKDLEVLTIEDSENKLPYSKKVKLKSLIVLQYIILLIVSFFI